MRGAGRTDTRSGERTTAASEGAETSAGQAAGSNGSAAAVAAAVSAEAVQPRDDLHFDEALRSIQDRALTYLHAGASVHFRGPAGVGKTTLAHHLAARLGRPVTLLTGDGWHTAANLVGDVVGSATETVRDRYIHSVTKTASATTLLWEDRALTLAMQNGWTLVYDEFTRSPAEANNPLLSALEERILVLPGAAATAGRRSRVVKAHPDFRVILTSNPSDYAAVKTPQDALLDRMVTFDLTWIEPATEAGIVARRSGLDLRDARRIVALVRGLRRETDAPQASMRAAIMLARIAAQADMAATVEDGRFVEACFDVLAGGVAPETEEAREALLEALGRLVAHHCPAATSHAA